jgi:TP901 family phage tail tape measure protein
VFVEIGADAQQFFSALNRVQKEIGKIGQSVASAGTKMMGIGAAVTAPILASAQAFANVGSALNDMSQRTGVAAEALSVLKFAAEQTGTDMGAVETAVKKMQKAIFAASGGSKEAADALAMVGLSAEDLQGLSADQQMAKIADGLMAIEDPGARAAIAMQLFGKAGTMILPMLEGGSAGMAAFAAQAARLGLIMDNETAAKADTLGDAIDALKASMAMAFVQIGSAVAPILTSIAQKLAVVAAAVGKFISSNQQLVVNALKLGAAFTVGGAAVFAAGKSISFLASSFGVLLNASGSVFGVLKAIGGGAISVAMSFLKAVAGVISFSAASVASAVASGAAWATANAPLLILLGILGGLGALAVNAMGGLQGIADSVSGGLNGALSNAMTLFGDLLGTATTTFNGIYDAIATGDLAGAMDILWAGLHAGWLRGVEALMGFVDPWIAMFQNTFTYLGTGIATTWESMWSGLVQGANTIGAVVLGVVDNLVNGVMAAFDAMVAAVRKSWNWVQSFIVKGYDLARENSKVDSEMAARARQRQASRPGVEGRMARAGQENAATASATQGRIDAMNQAADATAMGRLTANDARAAERSAATQAAEALLESLTKDQADRRAAAEADAASKTAARLPGSEPVDVDAVAKTAAAAAASQAEVAGTFSADAVGGMSFGQSMAQKQLDTLNKIENNTRNDDAGAVAA